jgi:hypothetical protein
VRGRGKERGGGEEGIKKPVGGPHSCLLVWSTRFRGRRVRKN